MITVALTMISVTFAAASRVGRVAAEAHEAGLGGAKNRRGAPRREAQLKNPRRDAVEMCARCTDGKGYIALFLSAGGLKSWHRPFLF